MDDPDLEARVIALAAANLRRARRHAIWLERLGVGVVALVASLGFVFAGVDLAWTAPALAAVLAALVVWGVLRGLALLLHLRVDQALLVDDD